MHMNVLTYRYYQYLLDTLEKLSENRLPIVNYFELCASYILEYETLLRKGHIHNNLDTHQTNTPNNSYAKAKSNKANNQKGIELKVKISSYEQILPIWVTKDILITLTLKNLSLSSFKLNTHSNTNIYYQPEYPTGMLLARIGSSEEDNDNKKSNEGPSLYQYFLLTENNTLEYTSPYTGPLFLVYNTEHTIITHQIHHSFTLIVKNAQYKPYGQLYKSLGLKYYHYETDQEKSDCLIHIINLLRSNPPYFANVFLKQMIHCNTAIKELYDQLIQLKEIPLFNYSNYIYQHLIIKRKAAVKSNIVSSSDAIMINNIEPSLEDNIVGLEECITLVKDNVIPLQVIISLLVDEDSISKRNRKILLNPSLIYYASNITLVPPTTSDYLCIQEFCSNDTQMFQ